MKKDECAISQTIKEIIYTIETNMHTTIVFSFFALLFCSFTSPFSCVIAQESFSSYFHASTTPLLHYVKAIDIGEPNSQLNGVNCIYVINLDERPQKWARIKPILDSLGLKVNRVSGINGRKLSEDVKRDLFGPYFPGINGGLNGGHIGCFLSHLSIMKDAYDRQYTTIWVMEDDIDPIEKDVQKKIPALLSELNRLDPYWDLFYTDTNSKNDKGEYIPSLALAPRPDQQLLPIEYYTKRIPLTNNIMKIGQRFGMYSVLISRRGLEKLIRHFSHVYLWSPIDVDIHYIPGIRQYATRRDVVSHWSGTGFSDTLGRE